MPEMSEWYSTRVHNHKHISTCISTSFLRRMHLLCGICLQQRDATSCRCVSLSHNTRTHRDFNPWNVWKHTSHARNALYEQNYDVLPQMKCRETRAEFPDVPVESIRPHATRDELQLKLQTNECNMSWIRWWNWNGTVEKEWSVASWSKLRHLCSLAVRSNLILMDIIWRMKSCLYYEVIFMNY